MNIQVDKTSVCAPSILRFEVVNAPSGSVFLWDVGKGSMYGADTLYTFFDESATVNANVEVTLPDNSTCQLSVPGISEIHALPVPEFVSSRNILCDGPDTVQFVDLTPNVASRSWIVDGTNYNNASQVLSHKFVSPGLKSLSLVVTDSNGCNGVKDFNDTIMVYPLPKFDFKADVRKGCAPESVLFNLTKDPAIDTFSKSYKWTFDGVANGTIQQRDSISLQYADAGDFAVTLEVAVGNGCEYTVTKNNFITLGDTAAIELLPPSKVFCENEMVVIKQSNTDVTGEIIWDFSGVRHDLISTSNEEARLIARDVGNLNISLSYNHNGCLYNVNL